jgi:hypothetical protein
MTFTITGPEFFASLGIGFVLVYLIGVITVLRADRRGGDFISFRFGWRGALLWPWVLGWFVWPRRRR